MTDSLILDVKTGKPPEAASGDCCAVPEAVDAPIKAPCPVSGTLSKKVLHETVESLIVKEKCHIIAGVQYYYCTDADCPVVYFSNEDVPAFSIEDVSVKVFSKDPGEDIQVCYCFNWTRKRIREQVEDTGTSTAFDEITKEVKAGTCECETKNPKGACCLGDVSGFTAGIIRDVSKVGSL